MSQAKESNKQNRWNKQEKNRYLMYLVEKKEMFQFRYIPRQTFQQMVNFISTNKGYKQCYNYHDRMRKKYGSYHGIIKALKSNNKVDEQAFEEEIHKMQVEKEEITNKILMRKTDTQSNQDCLKLLDSMKPLLEKVKQNNNDLMKEQIKEKQEFNSGQKIRKYPDSTVKEIQRFRLIRNQPIIANLTFLSNINE